MTHRFTASSPDAIDFGSFLLSSGQRNTDVFLTPATTQDKLKEVRTSYVVIPTSIDFMIDNTWMKISRSGLFVLGQATRKPTGIFSSL